MPKTIFQGPHTQLVETLVEARKKAGLTQAQLATRIARDQTFISLIERGQRRVDVIEFIEIARALSADPVELFGEVVERVPE